jgi:hypothetical protein
MKSEITRDQSGRINITTESGHFTVIPSDFSEEEILAEACSLHSYSASSDKWTDWVKKLIP